MTNQDRLDLQWRLLNDVHPEFCVSSRVRHSASSLLVEPEELEDSTVQEFQQAKNFYENLKRLPDLDLSDAGKALSAREWAEYEAKHDFNQPNALATDDVYEFWSRAELWSIGEAAALINGRNPTVVTEDEIDSDRSQAKISIKLKQMSILLKRAYDAGILSRYNNPKVLFDWLELKHIEMPQLLKNLVLQRSGTPFTLSAENRRLKETLAVLEAKPSSMEHEDNVGKVEKPFGQRERESLLKLILGMAIKGYSYDPKATKSGQINEIAGDLQILGLALDDDTVRKYLNEAKAIFADTITEQKG